MSAEVGILSQEELATIAKNELNEEPARLATDLQALKDWVAKQPHLQNINTSDNLLTFFLRGCKYSLERTKEKLDFFFSVRAALPEWFNNWDKIDGTLDLLNSGAMMLLKGFDKKGRRVFVFNMAGIDPNKHKVDDVYVLYFLIMEILINDLDQCSVTGFVSVNDSKAATMGHVTMMSNPVTMKKGTTVMQDAYPIRPKEMHMLNMPAIMDNVFNLFKNLMNQKMRERFQVHPIGDNSKAVECIGADLLPSELGGTNGTYQDHIEYTKNLINGKKDWLKEQTKFKTDETKRAGKPKNYGDIFGMEGSFRQLSVD